MRVLPGVPVALVRPSPSPDARQVVFSADFASPDSQLHLWIANTDGTGLRALASSPSAKMNEEPSWLSTGAIAFYSNGGASSNIWSVAPDGSRLVQFTQGSSKHAPSWSADGRKIAFVSDRKGRNDVWVINADGSGQSRITVLAGQANHPSFSPDGSALVFSETLNDRASLMVVDVDGAGLRPLTSGPYQDWNPSWGAGGIIFSTNRDPGSEHWKAWVIRPDGTGLQKCGDFLALDPVWTKEGNVLFSDETARNGALSAIALFTASTGLKAVVVNQGVCYAGRSIVAALQCAVRRALGL